MKKNPLLLAVLTFAISLFATQNDFAPENLTKLHIDNYAKLEKMKFEEHLKNGTIHKIAKDAAKIFYDDYFLSKKMIEFFRSTGDKKKEDAEIRYITNDLYFLNHIVFELFSSAQPKEESSKFIVSLLTNLENKPTITDKKYLTSLADLFLAKAFSYGILKDYRSGFAAFDTVIKLSPEKKPLHYKMRGLLKYEVNDYDGAIQDLRKCAELGDSSVSIEIGQIEEARRIKNRPIINVDNKITPRQDTPHHQGLTLPTETTPYRLGEINNTLRDILLWQQISH